MPYKFETEKKKIPRELDKRVKLSLEDREKIKEQYGKVSQRKLAKAFGVSRRLIQFIGDPEKHKQNLQRRKERNIIYYTKKNKDYMKKHRQYKNELNKKDLLEVENV